MKRQRRIAENVADVRGRIAEAARRSGREAAAVRLVAVTKYGNAETARLLHEAGCGDLGESRPQELWQKAEALADLDVRWHLVGHLQRNKVRRALPLVRLLHSADRRLLLAELERVLAETDRTQDALLEINVSGEAAKHGFLPQEAPTLLAELAEFPHVRVRGLMAMAGLESGPEGARREFAALRELRDHFQAEFGDNIDLSELSMGMSRDYEIAIEEGATIVRVGSALLAGAM